MSALKLFTFYLSSTAWRARIALSLKQLKADHIYIDLFKGDQRSEEYKKVNPNAGVPSLILPNGTTLVESLAIIEYLNEKYPSPNNLYPGDAEHRAKIRGFCEVINSGIHPYQNLKLVNRLADENGVDKVKWITSQVLTGANTIERLLENYSSQKYKYCFGDEVTAADILFYPQIFATKNRWKVDTTSHTNV